MTMTHDDFRKLKDEIEEALVDKTKRALTNSFLKWSGILFATASIAISYGGWYVLSDQIDKEVQEKIGPTMVEVENTHKDLLRERLKLQSETEDLIAVKSDMEEFREDFARNLADQEESFDSAEHLIEQLYWSRDYAASLFPIVLHMRDQLLSEAAGFRPRAIGIEPVADGYSMSIIGPKSNAITPPLLWGERKIVILRETPSVTRKEDLSQAQELYDARIKRLSAQLRIAFVTMGYEVDEWDVTTEDKLHLVSEQFARNIKAMDSLVDQPTILGHADFEEGGDKINALLNHMSGIESLRAVGSMISADFEPETSFLSSYSGGRVTNSAFEPTDLLIVLLPWDVGRRAKA